MKRFQWVLLLAVLIIAGRAEIVQAAGNAEQTEDHAETAEQLAERTAASLETDKIGEFWNDIMTEYGGLLPESQKGSLMEFINGDKSFSPQEWLKALFSYLFHEVLANGKLLGTLILLTI